MSLIDQRPPSLVAWERITKSLAGGQLVMPGGRWSLSSAQTPIDIDHILKALANTVASVKETQL